MLRYFALFLLLVPAPALARESVTASPPEKLSVTLYADPYGGRRPMYLEDLRGYAMISETRTIVLPAGPSTIRFEGVAEGMAAVTAIVTGLPGGTIEKNRNAAILSPAALVDGTLGNRVTIHRTNPATGAVRSESAIVRTRADGGLVLQTSAGYEAVGCAGIPEKLSFDRVPDGLSAQPIFSIDTHSDKGGTYQVTLSYLAGGFDWRANYLAMLEKGGKADSRALRLLAWLSLGNDNGQTFANAELLAVAGRIRVEENVNDLDVAPEGQPLTLACYPLGSTARGSLLPLPTYPAEPPLEYPRFGGSRDIVVTGTAIRGGALSLSDIAIAMKAGEETLGDLKLYRVPEKVTVAAQSMKQIAFLDQPKVTGKLFYRGNCTPYDARDEDETNALRLFLRTKNDKAHGLGLALPEGPVAVFEPTAAGDLLLGESSIRSYASGQEVEVPLSDESNVSSSCQEVDDKTDRRDDEWQVMRSRLTNPNGHPVNVEIAVADISRWTLRQPQGRHFIKDGRHILSITVPKNSSRMLQWEVGEVEDEPDDD